MDSPDVTLATEVFCSTWMKILPFWEFVCWRFHCQGGPALCSLKFKCLEIRVIWIHCCHHPPYPLLLRRRNPLPCLPLYETSKREWLHNVCKQKQTEMVQLTLFIELWSSPICPFSLQCYEWDGASQAFHKPVERRPCRAFVAIGKSTWWLQYSSLMGQCLLASLAWVASCHPQISNVFWAVVAL